ncbi:MULTISPECIES: DUF6207 family protein [unclassified Streptomyces]|uniref:DUF6207 family protein n=1 Tax=unclassified Streptomyces TaxID=2593676 RepID=UPI00223FDCB7|nr:MULTISPECIES: DUF6207 family protein [unclassified Streptomyces]
MESFSEVHVSEPGLIVVDVAAGDDETALAFQEAVAARWATAVADRTTRTPGRPGVRLRCYVDLRQVVGEVSLAPALPPGRWQQPPQA